MPLQSAALGLSLLNADYYLSLMGMDNSCVFLLLILVEADLVVVPFLLLVHY